MSKPVPHPESSMATRRAVEKDNAFELAPAGSFEAEHYLRQAERALSLRRGEKPDEPQPAG